MNNTETGWSDFVLKCMAQGSEKDLATFFDMFLTISEKVELGKRFNIIKELLQGEKTQREIARDLKVSIANVSRGANVLKTYPQNIKQLLQI